MLVPLETGAIKPNPEELTETDSTAATTLDPKLKEITNHSEQLSRFIVTGSSLEGSHVENILNEMDQVEVKNHVDFIDGVSVEAPKNAVDKIKNVKGITSIWKDRRKHVMGSKQRLRQVHISRSYTGEP